MRERRVGEGERGERRAGGDRKGGRSLGVRRHAQQIGPHTNPRVHPLACVRECGARASRIEGWARGWRLLLTGGNAQSRGQAIG